MMKRSMLQTTGVDQEVTGSLSLTVCQFLLLSIWKTHIQGTSKTEGNSYNPTHQSPPILLRLRLTSMQLHQEQMLKLGVGGYFQGVAGILGRVRVNCGNKLCVYSHEFELRGAT